MEAEEYRQICSKPESFARGDLETTHRILLERSSSVALLIEATLDAQPITKPDKHKGGSDTDHFLVQLGEDVVERILVHVQDAELAVLGREWETTPEASRIGSLTGSWTRLIDRE